MPEEPESPEPTEAYELAEKLKDAAESSGHSLTSVSIIISALSIIGPLLLILSHRAQNMVAIYEAQSADQWQYYMSKRTRINATTQEVDLLTLLSPAASGGGSRKSDLERQNNTEKLIQTLNTRLEKWDADSKEAQERAQNLSAQAERAGTQIDRITVGQAILQIGLLMSSITLYTRKRAFLILGLVFGAVGVSVALLASFFP